MGIAREAEVPALHTREAAMSAQENLSKIMNTLGLCGSVVLGMY